VWNSMGSPYVYEASKEELEDDHNKEFVNQMRCLGNFKIYKFNLYNTKDNKQNHILYCDDYRFERLNGKIEDLTLKLKEIERNGAYLLFAPEKCLYSNKLIIPYESQLNGIYITGIFKYKKLNYIYSIQDTTSWDNRKVIEITVDNNGKKRGVSYFTTIKDYSN
jgi:hypothetical protein